MPGELSGQVAAHTQVHYVAGLNFCVFASMIVYPRNTKRRNHPPGSSGFFPAEMNPSGRNKLWRPALSEMYLNPLWAYAQRDRRTTSEG